MDTYTREAILDMVDEEDVEFIRLQFTDMFGSLKNIAIPASKLEKALDHQCKIDVSLISELYRNEEEDMYLYPDLSTFTILPWRPQKGKVARFICDVYREDGTPYEENPRQILKKVIAQAAAQGYSLKINPEIEFFLFNTDERGMPTTKTNERAGYLDTSPVDLGENVRRDIVLALEDMGYDVASSHHEIAPGQHEVDFEMTDALEAADKVMTFKVAVRTIAKRHGLHATFMPKPKNGVNGSGMHVNMALYKNGKNIMTGSKEENYFSREGEAFMAGILAHIKGMTAICNPLVNSYKRLVPGFEAPSDINWSFKKRNALLKVYASKGEETMIELRSPDPSSNPYLVFAYCLAAGIEGIEKDMKAPAQMEAAGNIQQKENFDTWNDSLPENLHEALYALAGDTLFKEIAGDVLLKRYLKAKKEEWNNYLAQVSEWEIKQYLYRI